MRQKFLELLVGIFVLLGLLSLLVLAFKVSGLTTVLDKKGYYVKATFDNIGNLKPRAPVTIAGVRIGKVVSINLNQETFQAEVVLYLNDKYHTVPIDSSASILTEGLLGSNYISLSPGFKDVYLKNGDIINNTHPALILENLIGQFLFNAGTKNEAKSS